MAIKKKQAEYQSTGDLNRIISLGGGKYAYLIDENGKLNHMSTDDPAFILRCAEVNDKLDGRIVRQLRDMDWEHIADAVEKTELAEMDED